MALVVSSQPNKALKIFSLELYKIRARPLDFLVQNVGPFTTPSASQANLGFHCLILALIRLVFLHSGSFGVAHVLWEISSVYA